MYKDSVARALYIREEFEEQNPKPKYCGACDFLEDWDYRAPGVQPRLCVDCSGNFRRWYEHLDRYLEEQHGQRKNL